MITLIEETDPWRRHVITLMEKTYDITHGEVHNDNIH